MVKRERWGKEYTDRRNWREYNEKLVRRGELYLSLDFLDNWDKELERMNKGKRGRPFEYPEQFIMFMAFIYIFLHMPYRQMEGFLRKLSEFVPQLEAPDYTTLFKRIAKLELAMASRIPDRNGNIVIAVDSTGIKVTNRGEWLREKWKVHRGWIKVHIAVDVDEKFIVSIEVTDEKVSDSEKFEDLIDGAERNIGSGKISKTLGDKGYDSKRNFNILYEKNIETGILPKKNASAHSRGSPYRAKCVRELRDKGYNKWKEDTGYGKRWIVESIFSAITTTPDN